ncbi:MAG: protein kinase, partial [Myxococcota bacterium]
MSADTSSPKHGLASRRPKASPEDEALVGRTLAGRYRIDERVASGGMGVVYRAEQQPLGRPVALKVLKPPGDEGMKRQFTERFLLEAASMAQLQHPNTVVVHDFGESEGTLYFTMEFLAGETLTQRVRRVGPLEPEDAIHVAVQIASSLGDAHATGLIHRDLKPGNVMLLERGGDRLFVKVLDFGLVKLVGSDAKQQLTQSGIILGSPRYMAPEQVRGQSLGPAADVYAFGCLLTFLLTAQPPFPKGGPFEAMRAHVYEEPPGLRDLDPHCIAGERLEAVVARCLHKEPEARFGTMAELADALRHAALAPRVAASSALDLQVTFQRASAPSDAPAGDEAGPKQTTPLGAAPLPSVRALPPASRPPAGPGRAPLGAPTLPDGSGAPAASLAPPVEENSSGWSAAFGDATQAWRRFRVRILLAAAAMIALVGVVSLALFLPGGPLGVPLPPEPRTVAPAAAGQRPE